MYVLYVATFIAASEEVKWRAAGGKGYCSSAGGVPSESSEPEGGDGVSSEDYTKDEKVFTERAFQAVRYS